jgi:ParB family chromosome partitioning protein
MPRAKKKKPAVEPASRGLDARRLASAAAPTSVMTLARTIEDDGGTALASYRDPLGGHWQILASLPIDRVEPTPFQRDLSETHVERLAGAIDKLDRFLDPVIAVPAGDGKYWSPNGYHRLGAMKQLGAKSIVALVVPEPKSRTASCSSTPRRHTISASERSRWRAWPKRSRRSTTARSASLPSSSRRPPS